MFLIQLTKKRPGNVTVIMIGQSDVTFWHSNDKTTEDLTKTVLYLGWYAQSCRGLFRKILRFEMSLVMW